MQSLALLGGPTTISVASLHAGGTSILLAPSDCLQPRQREAHGSGCDSVDSLSGAQVPGTTLGHTQDHGVCRVMLGK